MSRNVPRPDHKPSDPPPRVNQSGAAPWSLDLRSWHLTWSDEVRAIHDAPSMVAPTLWQALRFVDPDDLPDLVDRAAASIRSGEPLETELGIVTASGVRKQVRLTAESLPDADGRPRMLEGTLAVVDKDVPEHPHGSAEARIAQLESALRDWEAFARAIPHELKSPMVTIEGLAWVLLKREHGALSERGRYYLDRIRLAAEHAKSLGESLLILAPMSMQAMRRESVDLSSIASRHIDHLRAGDETRTVEVTIQPGMGAVGDPDLLRTLVSNLLGNAWKFTSKQPAARIDFSLVTTGAHQTFCVSDNGVGFSMAQAGQLFTPLARLHGQGEFEGTGIGLTIARRVVQRHGGCIWADAREGEGAKFFFSLGESLQEPPASPA